MTTSAQLTRVLRDHQRDPRDPDLCICGLFKGGDIWSHQTAMCLVAKIVDLEIERPT